MLFYIALLLIPAVAAFGLQLLCYASYKNSGNSSILRPALQNG